MSELWKRIYDEIMLTEAYVIEHNRKMDETVRNTVGECDAKEPMTHQQFKEVLYSVVYGAESEGFMLGIETAFRLLCKFMS